MGNEVRRGFGRFLSAKQKLIQVHPNKPMEMFTKYDRRHKAKRTVAIVRKCVLSSYERLKNMTVNVLCVCVMLTFGYFGPALHLHSNHF